MSIELARRAEIHAALGAAHRLAIVDELTNADRAPSELAALLGIDSNLLAHHLNILERLGLIERVHSQADRRRRYLRLVPSAIRELVLHSPLTAARIVFICTENAARSQLAQAIWNQTQPIEAVSGGLQPASHVYPGAIRTARRRGLDMRNAKPKPLPPLQPTDLVVTVCDRAHENLYHPGHIRRLHWSIPDPAVSTRSDAYDTAAEQISARIQSLAANVEPPRRRGHSTATARPTKPSASR